MTLDALQEQLDEAKELVKENMREAFYAYLTKVCTDKPIAEMVVKVRIAGRKSDGVLWADFEVTVTAGCGVPVAHKIEAEVLQKLEESSELFCIWRDTGGRAYRFTATIDGVVEEQVAM